MKALQILLFAVFAALLGIAQAQPVPASTFDARKVREEERTKLNLYLTPKQAHDFVTRNRKQVLFLDVRTRVEPIYIGWTPLIDALVPYVEYPEMNADWGWDENRGAYKYEPFNDFAPEVERRLKEKGLTKDDPVVVMCRSGDRSSRAANLLTDLGYKRVYSVVGGFEGVWDEKANKRVGGWKGSGLPWDYDLEKSKMYFVR
jgi:rhodanese-related sulfurtransferase